MTEQVTAGKALELAYNVDSNHGLDYKSIAIKPSLDSDDEFDQALEFGKKLLGRTSRIREKNPDAFALALRAMAVVYRNNGMAATNTGFRLTAVLMLDDLSDDAQIDCLDDAANLMDAMLKDNDWFKEHWESAKIFCKQHLKALRAEQLASFFSRSYAINTAFSGAGVLDSYMHDNRFAVAFDGIELTPMLSTLIRGTLGLPEKELWQVSAKDRPLNLISRDDYRRRLDDLVDVLNRLDGHGLRTPIDADNAVVVVQTMELLRCGYVIAPSEERKGKYLNACKVLSDVFFGKPGEGLGPSKKLFKKHPGSTLWKSRYQVKRCIKLLDHTIGGWGEHDDLSKVTARARLFLLAGILSLYSSKKDDVVEATSVTIRDYVRNHYAVLLDSQGSSSLDKTARTALIDLSSTIEDTTFLARFLEKNKSVRGYALDSALGL